MLLSSPPLGPPASALPTLCTSSASSVCTNMVSGLGSNWPCIQPGTSCILKEQGRHGCLGLPWIRLGGHAGLTKLAHRTGSMRSCPPHCVPRGLHSHPFQRPRRAVATFITMPSPWPESPRKEPHFLVWCFCQSWLKTSEAPQGPARGTFYKCQQE